MNPPAKRVLVVEDDPVSRGFLEIALARQGYAVSVAGDVTEAEQQLSPAGIGAFSCVVTDYRMPGRTGLDLLAWIKESDPSLATILVTGESERHLIAESLRGGAMDFLDKPVDGNRLHAAVARAVERTSRDRHRAESEAAVMDFRRAQQRMLGVEALRNLGRVDVYHHPKHEAGGDFFSRFRPAPDLMFCLLTDVSGHDLQAAYISAYFHGLVRGLLARGTPIQEIFPDFNRFLLEEWSQADASQPRDTNVGASVAACAVLLDFGAQTATVLTQGTPAPIYIRPDGDAEAVGRSGGAPLGWFGELVPSGGLCSIARGGQFYLWTDGLEDLAEKKGVTAPSLAFAMQAAKEGFQPSPGFEAAADDILLARIHVSEPGPAEALYRPLIVECYHGGQTGDIDRLQALWQRSLTLAVPGLPESRLHDVLLASRESLLNALLHGCGGRPDRAAGFQAAYCPARQTLRVRVDDSGPGHHFDLAGQERLAAHEPPEKHRGLMLIHRLAGNLAFERDGAGVLMDFDWP